MGLIKAAVGSIGGTLADSWLDYITAYNMDEGTLVTPGIQVSNKRSSNKKYTPGVISDGSKIIVGPNQMMVLLDGGKVVDYTAEEGYYEYSLGRAPSLFNGQLGDSLRETWNRFKFGGQPSATQNVVFVNLREIRGLKFGTRNPLQYFDNFYNAELFLRCHGTYSIKITDPMKFLMEVVPGNLSRVTINDLNEQFLQEFLNALQTAIGQMSVDGIRISNLPAKSMELSKYMANALDDEWKNLRGMEIVSVGIGSISYDEDSKKLINMRNRGAMLSDPVIREGYVQGAVAEGINAAGSNSNGAANAFVGMGMGMGSAGNFMQSASQTNMAQMQAQAANNYNNSDSWTCSCGAINKGKFCSNCGKPKPENKSNSANTWTCSCGNINTGNFCSNCGKPKPADNTWTCSCGTVNKGKFCSNCGKPRQ